MTDAASLIRRFEGLRLETYLDKGGKPTIGYGCTGVMVTTDQVILPGLVISERQAEDELAVRLAKLQADLRRALKAPVTPWQWAALCSLAWNEGAGAIATSTLMEKLNAGDVQGAADEFNRWRFIHVTGADGKRVAVEDPLLVRRRYYERLVFLGDDDPTPPHGTPNPLTTPKE